MTCWRISEASCTYDATPAKTTADDEELNPPAITNHSHPVRGALGSRSSFPRRLPFCSLRTQHLREFFTCVDQQNTSFCKYQKTVQFQEVQNSILHCVSGIENIVQAYAHHLAGPKLTLDQKIYIEWQDISSSGMQYIERFLL